jgi:hypothetical protein
LAGLHRQETPAPTLIIVKELESSAVIKQLILIIIRLSGGKIRVNGKMVAFSREEIATLCHIRLVSPASSILLRIQEDGMKFLRAAGLLIAIAHHGVSWNTTPPPWGPPTGAVP